MNDENKIDANGIWTNSEIKEDIEAILLPLFQVDLILLPILRHEVLFSTTPCE